MKTVARCPIERFLELYYQPVFRFASRLCGDPVRALLLTQHAFQTAFDRSRSLPIPANVRAWLFTIVFHQFLEIRTRNLPV